MLAAGNAGTNSIGRETMSAWAEAPWVVAVGATGDEAGNQLAAYSSVGVPGIPASGPDLVSFGQSELDFNVQGTSFAAPRVARSAAVLASAILTLRHFVQRLLEQTVEGIPAVGVAYIDAEIYPVDEPWMFRALPAAGVAEDSLKSALGLIQKAGRNVSVNVGPAVLRQLLAWSARPVLAEAPHEVGLGLSTTTRSRSSSASSQALI